MLRALYDRILRLSATKWALPTLAAVSFAEASFFPVIPEVILAPMILSRRDKAWLYAAVCSAASVVGGLLGYAIGMFLVPLANAIIGFFGHGQSTETYRAWYGQYGFWILIVKGFTPIPFKLVTITSGIFHYNLGLFVLAATLTRSARFFLEAALLQHPMAKAFVDRYLWQLAIGGVLLIVVAILALKLLHI